MAKPVLRVVGPFRGASGHGRHTRELVAALARLGVTVDVSEAAPATRGGVVLHMAMPPHAAPVPGVRNANYTMFEADRLPPSWVQLVCRHDLVVVPTACVRETFSRSGVPDELLEVVPLGVDARFFGAAAAPAPILTSAGEDLTQRRVRFLNVAELRPRKNHAGLIRAWLRATTVDDDAALVLKVSAFQPDALARFAADVRDVEAAAGRTLDQAAPLVVISETLDDQRLRSLYRSATHYLSMSFGEGWDLAAMEAAAAGLRLLVPRHTAYAENYREGEVDFLPARLVPAVVTGRTGAEDAVLFDGLRWWEPDEDAAVAAIRAAIHGEAAPVSPPGPRLATERTWDEAARRLLHALGRLA